MKFKKDCSTTLKLLCIFIFLVSSSLLSQEIKTFEDAYPVYYSIDIQSTSLSKKLSDSIIIDFNSLLTRQTNLTDYTIHISIDKFWFNLIYNFKSLNSFNTWFLSDSINQILNPIKQYSAVDLTINKFLKFKKFSSPDSIKYSGSKNIDVTSMPIKYTLDFYKKSEQDKSREIFLSLLNRLDELDSTSSFNFRIISNGFHAGINLEFSNKNSFLHWINQKIHLI